ncbi:type II restriction endonuclease LlaDCHI [Deltaproteobacteria bacterium]|nr:type II restriction endonuclease LlaDCHI [Deltaproteobacteria bacterium]
MDAIKVELNILNSLLGSTNVENEFESLITKYPECLKCVPLLLAVRESEIYAIDGDDEFRFSFREMNYTVDKYKMFMRKTGLFDLLKQRVLSSLVDYATGIETGLDSNGRKNRGGHLMENLVESYLQKYGFVKDDTYFKEIRISDIEAKWGISLSALSNEGKTVKRFDFVVKTAACIYGIETNFYSSSGSKLNETARSYKTIAIGSSDIQGFAFVWFTDGQGWRDARHNLKEIFDVMEHSYNIDDLESGVMSRIFI